MKRGLLELKHFPLNQVANINPDDKRWVEFAIDPQKPVVFVDTDGSHDCTQSTFTGFEIDGPVNKREALIIERLILALQAAGLDTSSIGVITPFRSQVSSRNESCVISTQKQTHSFSYYSCGCWMKIW